MQQQQQQQQLNLDFAFFFLGNMYITFPRKWNTKYFILIWNQIIWSPLPFFFRWWGCYLVVRRRIKLKAIKKNMNDGEHCLGQKMKSSDPCPTTARITSVAWQKPMLSWLTQCVDFWGGCFSWSTNTKHKIEEIISLPAWACGLERWAVGFWQLQGMMGTQMVPACQILHMLFYNTSPISPTPFFKMQ